MAVEVRALAAELVWHAKTEDEAQGQVVAGQTACLRNCSRYCEEIRQVAGLAAAGGAAAVEQPEVETSGSAKRAHTVLVFRALTDASVQEATMELENRIAARDWRRSVGLVSMQYDLLTPTAMLPHEASYDREQRIEEVLVAFCIEEARHLITDEAATEAAAEQQAAVAKRPYQS